MKKKNSYCQVLSRFESSLDVLFSLESVIKLTQEYCQDKEFGAIYYDLPIKEKFILSEERNHYINLLSIALDKVSLLKEISLFIEKELADL